MGIIPPVNIHETKITFHKGGLALIEIKASIGSFQRQINRFYPVSPPSERSVDFEKAGVFQQCKREANDINHVIQKAEADAEREIRQLYQPYQTKLDNIHKRLVRLEQEQRIKTIPQSPKAVTPIKPNLPYRKVVN